MLAALIDARLAFRLRSPATRVTAQSPEWRELVAAAKKEGKVVVNTFPGDGYARALKPFTQAFPEIKLEHTNLHSQDFAPRILQERQANIFTWDLALIPTSTAEGVEKIFNARAELLYAGISGGRERLSASERRDIMATVETFERSRARS